MSYASEVLADSPLLYVRFQETSGATCANSGSLGGDATAAGTYTRNIAMGQAGLDIGIDLDGTSGKVSYPDTASLDITGDVTYECWFNADTLHNGTLMSKGSTSTSEGYEMRWRSTGAVQVLKTGVTIIVATPATLAATTLYHCCFTRSGNNYAIYINGSSVATATDASVIDATSEVFAIGHNPNDGGAAGFFNGKMDEVAVYNTALSGARIAAHYAARNDSGGGSTFVPSVVIIG